MFPQFPTASSSAANPALLRKRLHLIMQVLLDVFENRPVVAVAFGIAEATKALEAGEDVLSAIDAAVQAIDEWPRSDRGSRPTMGCRPLRVGCNGPHRREEGPS